MQSPARQKSLARKRRDERLAPPTHGRVMKLCRWLVPALLFLLTLVVFSPALHNDFVDWDDYDNFVVNQQYRGLGLTQLTWMFTTFHMGIYFPLTWMSLGLDYVLWGMDPFGYHLTSLFLHATNAVLFYLLALRLLLLARGAEASEESRAAAAAFSALFFALHPLRVESVAWVSARNDVLACLFLLCAVMCYLRAAAVTSQGSSRWRWMIAAATIFCLSLLSKASGMALPIVLLILDVYPLRRLPAANGRWFDHTVRVVWWEKVPFFLLAAGAGVISALAKYQSGAMYAFDDFGIVSRLGQALIGLTFYLWKTLVPLGLSPLYELKSQLNWSDWPVLLGGVVVITLSSIAFAVRKRWPAWLAVWISYVVFLLPVSGLAQSGLQLTADRYSYIPCLGWPMMLGGLVLYAAQRHDHGGTAFPPGAYALVLVSLVMVGLGSLSWTQTQIWRDSETLWRHAAVLDPSSARAHNYLGGTLFQRAKLEEAILHYRKALEVDPAYASAHNGLGNALAVRGDLKGAVLSYRRALELNPNYASAHNNLGLALVRQDEREQAVSHFRQALSANPAYAKAHYNLANTLASRGELEEAIRHYRKVLEIDPGSAPAHNNLAIALGMRGELEEAIFHFRQALRIEPEFAVAHEGLARALALQGEKQEASEHYEEAIRILRSPKSTGRGASGLSREDRRG